MDYLLLIFSLILWAISVFFSYKYRVLLYTVLGIFFVMIIFSSLFLIADLFTGTGINQAVIYHLFAPRWSWDYIRDYDKMMILIWWFFTSFFIVFYVIKNKKYFLGKWNIFLAICFALFSVLMHPWAKDMYQVTYGYYKDYYQTQENVEKDFVTQIDFQPHTQTQNLVYLYLESLELQYLDNQKFPWLTPNLTALSQKHTSFSNVRQLPWTWWTIAGMVSSQCGIPLIVWNKALSDTQRFYPKALCMWDILAQHWYFLSYMWWADKTFAWKDAFYETHSFDEIIWKNDVDWVYDESPWGLYDEVTLDLFYKKYEELSQQDQRFWLFGLTLDTHGPNGYASPSCPVYIQEENNILNGVHCTDFLIGQLMEKMQSSQQFQDTLVVLASDHLQMWNQNNHKLSWQEFDRKNLFLILDGGEKQYDSVMSSLDISPIVLDYLWISIDEIWFGKNILKWYTSFIDKYYQKTEAKDDYYYARKVLFSYKQEISEFLDFPYINEKLLINNKDQKLILWEQEYKYPLLVFFDENKKIYDIILSQWNSYDLASYDKTQWYLWIDECRKIDSTQPDSNKYCYDFNISNN